jgi:hypothetical protein
MIVLDVYEIKTTRRKISDNAKEYKNLSTLNTLCYIIPVIITSVKIFVVNSVLVFAYSLRVI